MQQDDAYIDEEHVKWLQEVRMHSGNVPKATMACNANSMCD